MELKVLYEDGHWEPVAGHPGLLGAKSARSSTTGKGKRRLSFLTHPEDRERFLTAVGSRNYANDTLKAIQQGGTPSTSEVRPPTGGDITEVGSKAYAEGTVAASRKWIGKSPKLGQLGI